jgi:hypothetical protein
MKRVDSLRFGLVPEKWVADVKMEETEEEISAVVARQRCIVMDLPDQSRIGAFDMMEGLVGSHGIDLRVEIPFGTNRLDAGTPAAATASSVDLRLTSARFS